MKNNGFTFIELLIVIAIIALLAVAVFVALDPATRIKRAHDIQREVETSQLQKALVMYQIKFGAFPTNTENDNVGWDCSNLGSSFIQPLVANGYIKTFPKDPNPSDPVGCGYYYYDYLWTADPNNGCNAILYIVMVHMELPSDANMDNVPNCWVQKAWYLSQGYYGFGETM